MLIWEREARRGDGTRLALDIYAAHLQPLTPLP